MKGKVKIWLCKDILKPEIVGRIKPPLSAPKLKAITLMFFSFIISMNSYFLLQIARSKQQNSDYWMALQN